jgi:hypothetical protein
MKNFIVVLFLLSLSKPSNAQSRNEDSIKVVNTLLYILQNSAHVNFSDTNVLKLGTFYKVAPYIVYRGKDLKRKWKDNCNYALEEDKLGVDEICFKLNRTINKVDTFIIEKYSTEKESEGIWHILTISFNLKGKNKVMQFAFLKPGKTYLLGDID